MGIAMMAAFTLGLFVGFFLALIGVAVGIVYQAVRKPVVVDDAKP